MYLYRLNQIVRLSVSEEQGEEGRDDIYEKEEEGREREREHEKERKRKSDVRVTVSPLTVQSADGWID
jgi:hypothetical protein